jgi:hypothetical protein
MKLTTHFLKKSANPFQKPQCFSSPSGEFTSVEEAADIAKSTANGQKIMADSFFITDEKNKELGRWKRKGKDWEKVAL